MLAELMSELPTGHPGCLIADTLSAVADGGIILSKVLKDKNALPRQIMLYRGYVRAVFLGA